MKKRTRTAILAVALVAALGTAALAAGGAMSITVTPDVKVLVNGEPFVPHDVTGREVPVFAYEGTTYVPIRAVSEAFGLDVAYDAAQKAAVISSVAAPDPEVQYILSCAPETATMEDGSQETFYNDVEFDFHWLLENQSQSITVALVSGELPDGISLKDAKLEGQCQSACDQRAVFRVTPRGGEAFERTVRFVFTEGSQFNCAPVVIWGRAGDEVENYIQAFYNGILYTGDDLTAANTKIHLAEAGSSPIGTKAALDELAKYGLSFGYETRTDDNEFYWADNFVTGTLTGSTNGWVKISVPVYAGMGSAHADKDGNLELGSWWVTGEGDDTAIVTGSVDVYLNIIPFA